MLLHRQVIITGISLSEIIVTSYSIAGGTYHATVLAHDFLQPRHAGSPRDTVHASTCTGHVTSFLAGSRTLGRLFDFRHRIPAIKAARRYYIHF